jgi:hypothetical protein
VHEIMRELKMVDVVRTRGVDDGERVRHAVGKDRPPPRTGCSRDA